VSRPQPYAPRRNHKCPSTEQADHNTSRGKDQLDVTEAEAMLQPNRMLDDFDRVAEAATGIG
jgi:hypothetical protein